MPDIPDDNDALGSGTGTQSGVPEYGDYVWNPSTGKYEQRPGAQASGGGGVPLNWFEKIFSGLSGGGGGGGMNWGGLIGGLLGGYGSYVGGKEQNEAGKDAGKVDIVSESQPWGPSEAYRRWLIEQGGRLAGAPGAGIAAGGTPAPTTGGGLQAPAVPPSGTRRPDGRIIDAQGRTIFTPPAGGAAPRGRNRGAGGGGGATAGGGGAAAPAAPFEGASPETGQIRDALMRRAAAGDPLYAGADSFTLDTLSGDPSRDRNAYRTEAAGLLREVPNDPNLQRFTDLLFASDTGLGGGGAAQREQGPRVNAGNRAALSRAYAVTPGPNDAGAMGPGAGATAGPVGVVDDYQRILEGRFLSEENPHLEAVLGRTRTQADEAFAAAQRQNALRAAGSGMYGATPWQNIEAESTADYGVGLGQALGGIRYEEYERRMADLMAALQGGAAYDVAHLDRAAQERMSAADRASADARSAGASSAAAAGLQAELASRERMGRLGALGEAVGMGTGLRQFRAGGFGELAGMLSEDQRAALGMVPDLSGLDIRDWGAAGELSLGSDATRTGFLADRGRERVGMAGVGVDRGRLAFDQERFRDPTTALGRYADLINSASGGAGSEREFGYDRRSSSPSRVNIFGQTLAGAAGGFDLGSTVGGR